MEFINLYLGSSMTLVHLGACALALLVCNAAFSCQAFHTKECLHMFRSRQERKKGHGLFQTAVGAIGQLRNGSYAGGTYQHEGAAYFFQYVYCSIKDRLLAVMELAAFPLFVMAESNKKLQLVGQHVKHCNCFYYVACLQCNHSACVLNCP